MAAAAAVDHSVVFGSSGTHHRLVVDLDHLVARMDLLTQPFTGHDAGEVDHLQVGGLGDERVRRQRDDVVAYPRQGLTLEMVDGRREDRKRERESEKLSRLS
ncbi:hypothetical protein EYF80_055906 [Liparis tanakae]|uniref:Uncharacterized protein n=1 Tax=Liparis tanakae TaxID=230148 RepID=A0A4Z2EY96_9TELE|nr:hypothetical protein EYF80_055906 [Liparis tanakae]